MKKLGILLTLVTVLLVIGCEEPEKIDLKSEDFEIRNARWDSELEFDCGHCERPICRFEMGWELTYQFNPRNGKEEALCWYSVDGKVKIRPILKKNRMTLGVGRLFDPDFMLNCWEDHKVGLCCAYSKEELLNDKYLCEDVTLKALCP